jgi:hypothetical protein
MAEAYWLFVKPSAKYRLDGLVGPILDFGELVNVLFVDSLVVE